MANHIYQDTMVPEVGNLFAYQKFLQTNKDQGYHVLTDLNSFKEINQFYGVTAGDQAIIDFGKLASKLAQSFGMQPFRVTGDRICLLC